VDLKPEKGEYLTNECIRCLKCRDACPQGCFQFGLVSLKKTKEHSSATYLNRRDAENAEKK